MAPRSQWPCASSEPRRACQRHEGQRVLRLWRLGQNGFGNEYYSAGVRSMAGSWHNFLYNAFDPAGFVSVDKPPVALWVQVASVKLFGFHPLSVLIPQALEGVAVVGLVYYLLTPERLARMVEAKEIRFVMVGDAPFISRRLGAEVAARPVTEWVQANGRPVDPTLWRSTGFGGRRGTMRLYDLRPGPLSATDP